MNAQNDRETDGYKAVDYIKYVYLLRILTVLINPFSTIARTLNASYHSQSYKGLGGFATTYPVSAFITHVVYLKNTTVEVDAGKVTVSRRGCHLNNSHNGLKLFSLRLWV